jgi:hypothetical protein
MKYAATYRSWLQGLQADDCTLGAWLRLNVYAADTESGINVGSSTKWRRIGQAKLRGLKGLDDPQLLRMTGTDGAGLARVVGAGLARWRGNDLVLDGYDVYGQRRASEKLRRLQEGLAAHKLPQAAHEGPPLREVAKGGPSSEVAQAPSPLPSPPLRGSGSGSDPSLQASIPSLRSANGRGAPHGATSAETGPEGFEAWAAVYPKWPADPGLRGNWREQAMQRWAAHDLEPYADEIIRHTQHQLQHAAQWKQRGPEGERFYFVKTPWNYLQAAQWTRRGPWTVEAAAPAAAQLERGGDPLPAGAVLATQQHGFLLQLINDVEASEDQREDAKRRWMKLNPGQLPPWAKQPQAPGAPS